MSMIQAFWKNEDGAVTVDWVVLTGGVVVVAALVGAAVSDPIDNEVAVVASIIETTN